MNTTLIAIGNSKGVRIPKPLLEESGIKNAIEMRVVKDGLKLTPIKPKKPVVSDTLLLSTASLAKEWDLPEEDKAWKNL